MIQAWLVNDLVVFSFEFVLQMKSKAEKQRFGHFLVLFQFPPRVKIYFMSLKFAKASLSLGFTSSTVVATRLKVQCHGIKHDALNNSYSKSYRRDIKTFTTNAAKINMKRRTEFCSGNAGDLKYFLRV